MIKINLPSPGNLYVPARHLIREPEVSSCRLGIEWLPPVRIGRSAWGIAVTDTRSYGSGEFNEDSGGFVSAREAVA